MEAVYEYPLLSNIGGTQILELPEGAQPLCVAMQDTRAMLWALVNPENPKTGMHVAIQATGQPLPDVVIHDGEGDWVYLSTMHDIEGWMVFHVFWRTPTGLENDK